MRPGARRLVLASRSPQRTAILRQLGVPFAVAPADVEEAAQGDPADVAEANARAKATALARPGATVLGVDTLVALDGEIHGKPAGAEHARATLARLSGRTHEVVSGLAVVEDARPARSATAVTAVTFRTLDDAWLDWYLAAGEWRDRAGGYAIQGRGAALVTRLEGDYLNVVGLPVALLIAMVPGLVTDR